ncbi:hypothetical protein GCK32_019928 [Trichostrongylus colubriformis]|uniref:Uncharacterized protein n=1 Tax=Trichostrongylus colubriformis TaxID=6319 RepID=A0AAN8EX71_TRICO
MRVLILTLLVAVCVSAALVNTEGSKKSSGGFKGMISRAGKNIKAAFKKLGNAINQKMMKFKKKLSKYKNKILDKLHLTKEKRAKLMERLKFWKRKNVDKVQPTGDSIEEINLQVRGGDMFQGDMALSRFVRLNSF